MKKGVYIYFFLFLSFWQVYSQTSQKIRIIGNIPDPKSNKSYILYIGAYKTNNYWANYWFRKLERNSLNPIRIRQRNFTLIAIRGVNSKDIPSYLKKLKTLGVSSVHIIEDKTIKKPNFPVSKVALPDKSWSQLASCIIKIGETKDITKLVNNKNPKKFKSSTPSIVTVDSKGIIRGMRIGSAFINITENEYISVIVIPKEDFYNVPESQFATIPINSASLGGTRDLGEYVTEPTFRLGWRFNNRGEYKGASGGNGGIDILFRADNYEWLWTTFYQGGWFYDLNNVKREMVNGYQKDITNGVELIIKPEFIYDEGIPYLQLRHILHNTSNVAVKNQKFGASADVMIHNNDYAPLLTEKYGAYMTDSTLTSTFELMFIARSGKGITPVDTLWLGGWYGGQHLYYTYIEALRDVRNIDSAIGFSYQNINLKPREKKEFIVRFTTVKTGEKILEKMEGKIIKTDKKTESDATDDKLIDDSSSDHLYNIDDDDIDFDDSLTKEITPVKYDDASPFEDGLSKVKLDGKYGLIDKDGKEITPIKYDDILPFKNNLAKVELNGKYGFIDKSGSEIIPIKYDDILPFKNNLAKVKIDRKYGFIDKTGKEITPVKYDNISTFEDDLAKVKIDRKYGFIDKTGKEIIPTKYDDILPFENNLAKVKIDEKYGFIDKTGKEITPVKYDNISIFEDSLAKVKIDIKYGFIDKTGKEIIPTKYDDIDNFKDGLAKVKLQDKWGFIDKTDKEIIPIKYIEVDKFTDGLAKVKLQDKKGNGKYGFIDNKDKVIIPIKYDDASSFKDGVAEVKLKGKMFFIDKKGKKLKLKK